MLAQLNAAALAKLVHVSLLFMTLKYDAQGIGQE